jgi:glycerate-2-kinase
MDDRSLLLGAFLSAIDGVDPEAATARAAAGLGLEDARRVVAVAAGKASLKMINGLSRVVDLADGVVVTPVRGAAPVPVVVGGHPVPTSGSVAGGRRALELASSTGPDDVLVCLVSGGASALLAAPAGGLTLDDLRDTNRVLLECGADITEVNAVRKHLSAVKGGRLGDAASPARLVTLILSDVVGDPLDVIASGPTVSDPTTYGDALAVVRRYDLGDRLPVAVVEHLERGAAGRIPETSKRPYPGHDIELVGSGSVAAEAAASFVRSRGIPARVATTRLAGDAHGAAAGVLTTRASGDEVLIFAGETTVTVTGSGRGGRNQEAALFVAAEIDGRSVTFLAGGTDGIDGPTDAAGGIVDGGTIGRGRRLGLDAAAALADNDAYPYLSATGDLIVTGPTGTNVADLWLIRWSRIPG